MYPMPKNKEMQSIITGMILGASYVRIASTSKNAMIITGHSIAQREYALHKSKLLENITSVYIKEEYIKFEGKSFPQIKVYSKNHPIYTKFRELFYINNVKQISMDILNLLTPQGIAIWYMDDGGLILHKRKNKDGSIAIKSRELCINTQCFSYEENELIVEYFFNAYGVKFNIYKNKSSYRIVCGAKEANKFIDIIKDYIIPSMFYKIDMQYKKIIY